MDECHPLRELHVGRAPSAGRVASDPNGLRIGLTSTVGSGHPLFPVAATSSVKSPARVTITSRECREITSTLVRKAAGGSRDPAPAVAEEPARTRDARVPRRALLGHRQ